MSACRAWTESLCWKILPDTVPIFMSGYSDKEYLKAAIKLKAVNYIEKPFRLSEIEDAIREARDLYIKKVNSRHGETLHSMETASRLALQLTLPYSQDNSVIRQLSDELQFTMNSSTFFTAFIVKTELFLEASTPSMADLFQKFQDFLNPYHITCVYLEKKLQYMVYFLFFTDSAFPPDPDSCRKFSDGTLCGIRKIFHGPRRHCRILIRMPHPLCWKSFSKVFPTTANFFRIRSKTCTTSFFSVWRMHVISRKFQVPAIRKLLRKQSTDVLPSVNFTRLLLIKQKIFLRKFLTVLRKTLLFF